MSELPSARVVRGGGDAAPAPRLCEPPRRIPPGVALRVLAGDRAARTVWLALLVSAALDAALRLLAIERGGMGVVGAVWLGFCGLGALAVLGTGGLQLGLLRRGVETRGEVVGRAPAPGGNVDLTLQYPLADGSLREATIRIAADSPAAAATARAQPLLYHPRRPAYAVPLDDVPGRPRLAADGTIADARGGLARVVALPAAALLVAAGALALALAR